jgi:hypothetical protein
MKTDLAAIIGSLTNTQPTPVAIAGVTPIPSLIVDCRNTNNLSIIGTPTGSISGSLQPWVSHDQITWVALGSAQAVAGGTKFRIPLVDLPDCWLQCIYTNATGTGTLYVTSNTKGF